MVKMTRLRAILTATANGSKRLLGLFSPATLAILLGGGLLIWGLYLVYQPLAFLVPGSLMLGVGGLLAWGEARKARTHE